MTLQKAAEELDINLGPALDRVVNNEGLYIHLLKVFINDSDMNCARQAAAQKDYDVIVERVHSMKGSAASLELMKMSQACYELVTAVRQQEYLRVDELFAKVEAEYAAVKNVIVQL